RHGIHHHHHHHHHHHQHHHHHHPHHHPLRKQLLRQAQARRSELPQRGEGGSLDCDSFIKTGACKVFNKLGHCSLHHPLSFHVVQTLSARCPQCTIRLPCGHCDYDRAQRRLLEFCLAALSRIQVR
ncbi:unnamed protein product, partial [Discosporangium mesarthrocarpum]